MKRFPSLKTLAILFISLFTGACAVDRPPTGGPPDTTPLAVIASSPEPGAVNVIPHKIIIEFNKYVTTAQITKAIFFSPAIRDYQITTHGRIAEIRLFSPLKAQRTYTVTLGKSLKSYYGTELASSWTLPFSTGPVIDSGTLDGKVWSRLMAPASNISILAYELPGPTPLLSDTLPSAPDFLTQTDADGNFRFRNLASGNYRLIALKDKNRNYRFDRGKDEYGVTTSPVVATGSSGISFRLATGDTSAVTLRSALPLSSREIEVSLSRSVPSRTLTPSAFSIREKQSGAAIQVLGCFTVSRAEEESAFRLFTAAMDSKSTYTISFAPPGVAPGQTSELTFPGISRSVNYPRLSVSIIPADKTANALLDKVRPDVGPCVELQFNLPVDETTLRRAVSLKSVSKAVEAEVPISISRYDSRTWSVRAQPGFEPGTDYVVRVRPTLVSALAGVKAKDSLVVSRFSSAGPDQYGEISGSGSTRASVAIVEVRTETSSSVIRAIVHPSPDGKFTYAFHGLPPGKYTVWAFTPAPGIPASLSTEWQGGSIKPFRPSDPFSAVTATVRAGWTTETLLPGIPSSPSQSQAEPVRPPNKRTIRKRH